MLCRRPNFRREAPYVRCQFQATISGEKKVYRLNAVSPEEK